MKTLIAYSSKTGNTKKVAEAIKLSLKNAHLESIENITNIDDYSLIIIGGWIDRATFDSIALNFTKSIANKKVGYFFTLGAYPTSDHAKECVNNIKNLFLEKNNIILSYYFCQGAIDPKLISMMSNLPKDHQMHPTDERKKRWKDSASHPDNNDLENAKKAFVNL